MAKVFISYRRSDSAFLIGRVYDRLTSRIGRGNVFKDIDSIPAGEDFTYHITKSLHQCVVVLVIIGPQWVTSQDENGSRRLDNPMDWVRVEIETAFRMGLVVIPVLVGGALMPSASDLPALLQPLSTLNALPARGDPDFQHDLDRIAHAVDQAIATRVRGARGLLISLRWRAWILRRQLFAAAGLLVVVALLLDMALSSPQVVSSTNPAMVARTANAYSAATASVIAEETFTALETQGAIASSTQTALVKSSQTSTAQAAETANAANAHAAETAVAVTATAAYIQSFRWPYTAQAPGPGCDPGPAKWLPPLSQATGVTCLQNPTRTHLKGGLTTILWYLTDQLTQEGHVEQHVTVSIDVSNLGAGTALSVEFMNSVKVVLTPVSYVVWDCITDANACTRSAIIPFTPTSTTTIMLSVGPGAICTINGQQVCNISANPAVSAMGSGIAIEVTQAEGGSGGAIQADLSNFILS